MGAIIVKLEELEKLSLEQISIKLGGGWGKSQLSKFKAFFLLVREFPLLMRLGGVFASTIMNNLKPLREYLTTSAGSALLSLSVFFSLSLSHKAHTGNKWREKFWEKPPLKISVKIGTQLLEFDMPIRSTIADLEAKMLEDHPTILPRLQWAGGYDLPKAYALDGIRSSEHLVQFVGLPGSGPGEEEKSFPPACTWKDSHCNLCWLEYFHGYNSEWRPPCHCTSFEFESRSVWDKTDQELDEEFAGDVAEMEAYYLKLKVGAFLF